MSSDRRQGCLRRRIREGQAAFAWVLLLTATVVLPPSPAPAGDPSSPSKPAATTLDSCDYYPLAVNTRWTYRAGQLMLREQVTAHEERQGEQCARIEALFDDRIVSVEHLAIRPDGIYRVAINDRPIVPPMKILSLPPKAGDRWTVNSEIAGKRLAGEFTASDSRFPVLSARGDADRNYESIRVTGSGFQFGGSEQSFEYEFLKTVGRSGSRRVTGGSRRRLS